MPPPSFRARLRAGPRTGLTTGLRAVLATSLSGNFGPGPRINLLPQSKSIGQRIQALKDAGVKGDLDNLKSRIGDDPGAIGELEAIERWLRNRAASVICGSLRSVSAWSGVLVVCLRTLQ